MMCAIGNKAKLTPLVSLWFLGGHLATAFNLLHPGAAQQVITFNGAGVGLIKDGEKLSDVLKSFTDLRDSTDIVIAKLEDADLKALKLSAILNQQDPYTHQTANQPDWRLRA